MDTTHSQLVSKGQQAVVLGGLSLVSALAQNQRCAAAARFYFENVKADAFAALTLEANSNAE